MTTGEQISGKQGKGAYRYRQWQGGDRPIPGEHSYTYAIRESYYPVCQYAYSFMPNYWMDGSMLTFSPLLPQSYVDHTVNLTNCATNKIGGDLIQSKFNAGVFAGEFRESYHMICDIVHAIARSIAYAKRGRWDKAMNVLTLAGPNPQSFTGVGANNYMMWHFGILPLLNDVKAAYEYLLHNYRKVKRVRRHCRYKDVQYKSSNFVTWTWEINALVEIRGDVEMIELSEADRLGLNDLASVAWELTKLSWLVDWLLPIGNFLSAVNASNLTKGGNFWITRMQKETLSGPKSNGFYIFRGFIDSSYDKYFQPGVSNSRSGLDSLPWHFPTIENPLGDNLSRWVTATAFLRQTVGR